MIIIYFRIIAQHTATLSTLLVMNCEVSLYMVLVAVGCSILMPPISFFFVIGDEFGEPIIAERMIRIADNPTSKGTVCIYSLQIHVHVHVHVCSLLVQGHI